MSKIAILSFYSGKTERGVETFVLEIANRLAKKHTITIFQAGNPRPFQKFKTTQIKFFASTPRSQQDILGKIYLNWQSLKILGFSLRAIPKFLKGKYQIVFVMNGGWQTVVFRYLTKLTGAKIIIPGEAGIGSDDAWNIMFRPDTFVALTNSQSVWAKRLQDEVRVEKIPNGVDLARFNPNIKPKETGLKKPIVVCTSALVKNKRIENTIKAVAKTKTLSLLLIGDGEMRGIVDGLGKRYLQHRYKRVTVPYEDIPSYYKAGDIFTLASKNEAFGTSYIEAMACNLPVVATSDDSRAEIIGDAGILTDPTNIDQYAKDLDLALKTDYKNKPYAQSLKFSWNKIAQAYETLISDLLKKNPRGNF